MQIPVKCPHCDRVTEIDSAKIPDKPVSFACPGCHGKVPVDGAKVKADAAGGSAQSAPDTDATGEALHHLEVPDEFRFPSGLLVGNDSVLLQELEKVLSPRGCTLRSCGTIAEAKSLMSLAMPELMFYRVKAVGTPPLEELKPLLEMPNDDRRRCFIVLVADNVKTLDGNAAFFHCVDLVMARTDVSLSDRVLFAALQFRDKLAGPFLEALAAVEG